MVNPEVNRLYDPCWKMNIKETSIGGMRYTIITKATLNPSEARDFQSSKLGSSSDPSMNVLKIRYI